MSRGSRNGTPTSNAGAAAAAAASQQQQQMRRGNKTLGWYISDKILDKSDQGQNNGGAGLESRASSTGTTTPQIMASSAMARPSPLAAVGVNNPARKGSLESQNSTTSSANSPKNYGQHQNSSAVDEQRHQHRKGHNSGGHHHHQHRPRANSTNLKPANSNKENHPQQQQRKDSGNAMASSGAGGPTASSSSRTSVKEDYWYYDPVSDGFYYEHSGTRGWRKRNPKVPLPNGVQPKQQMPQMKSTEEQLKQQQEIKDQQQQKQIQQLYQQPQQQTSVANRPSQQQPQQTSKFFPNVTSATVTTASPITTTIANSQSVNVPNIKYYDAASDGFFYEMASVDGWRRRQPIAGGSNGTTPPNGGNFQQQKPQQQQQLSGSGAANARIFHPSSAPKQQQQLQQFGRNGKVQQLTSGPLQHQPYLAKQPQQLTSAELDEIMMMHHATQPLNIFGSGHQHRHQRGMTVPPTSGGNAPPPSCCTTTATSCCCCQAVATSCPMASAAAQLLLQDRMQQLLIGGNASSRQFAADCGCCAEAPSNASVSSSLSSDVDAVESPPIGGGHTHQGMVTDSGCWQLPVQDSRHNSFGSSTGSQIRKWNGSEVQTNNSSNAGGNQQHPFSALLGSAQPMDIANSLPQKTLVGSFDEPYEFYWSDSDAKSNASSATMLAKIQQTNADSAPKSEAALSVSSMDTDDLDNSEATAATIGGPLKQLPVGSGGRPSMMMQDGIQQSHPKVQLKRPDSLRLLCPKLSDPAPAALVDLPTLTNGTNGCDNGTGKEPTPAAYRPYFNVDKFIADLPPFVDPEKILHNLSALRTPMTDQQNTFGSRTNGQALATTDSPLFTPILHKEENAWWTSSGLTHPKPIGGDRDPSSKANKQSTVMTDSGAAGGGLLLKDLERIWQCPPAAF